MRLRLVSVLVALGMLLVAVSPALAAEFRGGPEPTVAAGEVIHDDVYIAGTTVQIDGTIDGDLYAAGTTVIVNGRVTGSLNAAGETVTITGQVDRAVRAAGQTVTIGSSVAGDVVAAGQNLTVAGHVGRDLITAAETLDVREGVGRNVRAWANDATLAGTVGGDVDVSGVDQLSLANDALINGNLSYESAHDLSARDVREQVRGQVMRRDPAPQNGTDPVGRLLATLYSILTVTMLGAVALAVSPRGMNSAGSAIVQQPLLSLGWGFGLLLGMPLAAILLMFTAIGLPVAVVLLILYVILLYSSQAIVGLAVGRLLLSQLRPVAGYWWAVLSVLVGMLILEALRAVPIVGGVVTLLMLIGGLGGAWLAYAEARTAPPGPESPAPAAR
ncbi:MAG: hypothetical protein QOF51_823 [Chloroflexota bacterium]|nr:hypothetical protein [Chloroflexota bacterium]